jgi:phosphatidylserine/phosphatidylglycerophosphate/cardiolipin synthase-like enzyme
MHNKVLIVDGTDLYTGSYNLSDNAEHNTFENVLLFRGPEFTDLVKAYEERFEQLWATGKAEGLLSKLETTVKTADTIPLVFEPMALTHTEVTSLKALIRKNCPAVDSTIYRTDPVAHQTCPRP